MGEAEAEHKEVDEIKEDKGEQPQSSWKLKL